MPQCPQCKNKIPEGNDVCNLCGFNYAEFIKKESARSKKTRIKYQKAQITIISYLIVLGFVAAFLVEYTDKNPGQPFILPLIIVIIIIMTGLAVYLNKKNK